MIFLEEKLETTIGRPKYQAPEPLGKPQKLTPDEVQMAGSLIDALSLSDSESPTSLNKIEEAVEDLKLYIDCLLYLAPAFEYPAEDVTYKDKDKPQVVSGQVKSTVRLS
jgi:hypothetical protein